MPRILNSKAASCLERPASLAQLGKYTKGIMNPENIQVIFQYKPSSGSSGQVGVGGVWRWGKKHKIYVAVIGGYLFMPYFYRAGGELAPIPGSATETLLRIFKVLCQRIIASSAGCS